MRPHQALDVANVIFSVVTYCPMSVITQLPSDVATEFFSYLSRITCDFCRAAADESVRCVFVAFFTLSVRAEFASSQVLVCIVIL